MAEVLNQEQVLVNEDTLTTMADSIRLKLGEETNPNAAGFTKYTPMELANKIANEMPLAKDAIPNSAKHLTGNCQYRFAYNGWEWFIKQLGEEITTENLQNCQYMFSDCKLERIPFDINCSQGPVSLSSIFTNCKNLKVLPKITAKPSTIDNMFWSCQKLREIPEDFFDNFDWSSITGSTTGWDGAMDTMFNSCYSLRYIPIHKIKSNPAIGNSNSYFYNGFSNCYCLDELVDLPLPFTGAWTSNTFGSGPYSGCFLRLSRLKSLTFALNEGQPCVMNWKNQTIDLSQKVGYANQTFDIVAYNSGITADKQVTDDATYQALKNNPDWFTSKVKYSRYNHDSAVETINSLPDTSAYLAANGGTNTIKFTGAAGSATDGGAINTLTEAEIAVAAAKGWTVSLV